jgi:hypothetical protein
MRQHKFAVAIGIAVVAVIAGLVAWYEYPWNMRQCRELAAKMPTDAGVRAQLFQCFQDFPNP